MSDQLSVARDHLQAFRRRWSDGVVIDEQSGLTASDLDQILAGHEPETSLDEAISSAEKLDAGPVAEPDHFADGFKAFAAGGETPAGLDDGARELWREGFEHAHAADASRGEM